MFVIASTRPLPIHYEQTSQWYFKRGVYAAREVYYPFFVEVERGRELAPVVQYIERFIQQYSKYELAIHVDDWFVIFQLQRHFRHAVFKNGVVVLEQ